MTPDIELGPKASHTPLPSTGFSCGRVFKHWSQWPLGIAGAVSIVAALGAGTFAYYGSAPIVGTFGGVFCLSGTANCLGFICVRRFVPEKELEKNIEIVAEQKNQLERQVEQMKKEVDKLQKVNDNASRSNKSLKKDLGGTTNRLNRIAKRLEKREKDLQVFKQVFEKYKAETAEIAEQVRKFNEENAALDQNASKLEKTAERLGLHRKEIDKELEEFAQERTEYLQQLKEMLQLNDHLKEQLLRLAGHHEALKEARADFSGQITELDLLEDRMRELVGKYGAFLTRHAEVEEKFSETLRKSKLPDLQQTLLNALINKLKAIKDLNEVTELISDLKTLSSS